MSSSSPEFQPRPFTRRTWVILGLIIVGFVALYATIVVTYNNEGGYTTTVDSSALAAETTQVSVGIEPVSFDSGLNEGRLHVTFSADDPALVGAGDRTTENIRFVLDNQGGTQEFRFPAGSLLGARDIDLSTSGPPWQYPFDVHEGNAQISAEVYEKQSDGTLATVRPLAITIPVDPEAEAVGGVSGWDTLIAADENPTYANLQFTYSRAYSTKVFSLLLLLLALLLAVATVVVAFLVANGRRKADISLMSWTAALLFALPALRSFMPNSPPIGAEIDMYVYLWVMLGAIGAAITMIVVWVRQSGRAVRPAPVPPSGHREG
jgi:hypothetical protein